MEAIAEPSVAAERGPSVGDRDLVCMPWVSVAKNPDRFNKCVEAARRLGAIDTPRQLYDALCKFVREDGTNVLSQDQEVFWVILFDTHGYIRGVGEIARGARDRVQVPIPDVLRLPLVDGATAFAVLHTHPSGYAKPSQADAKLTKAIERAGQIMDLPLFDHLVIGSGEFYSFRTKKLYKVANGLSTRKKKGKP